HRLRQRHEGEAHLQAPRRRRERPPQVQAAQLAPSDHRRRPRRPQEPQVPPQVLDLQPAREKRPVKNVRALAAQVLAAAEKRFVDEALDAHRSAALSRRDRALLTTLVYGATRWRRELDWLIDRCAERVHPEIRQHLRIALFQIRHLDKIPRHAAVNEAVELAKGVSRKSAGFVNAVLRKAADMALPDTVGVRTYHPDWLVERWRKRFKPTELEALLAADNAVLPVTVRPNPLKPSGAIKINDDPTADPKFAEGGF